VRVKKKFNKILKKWNYFCSLKWGNNNVHLIFLKIYIMQVLYWKRLNTLNFWKRLKHLKTSHLLLVKCYIVRYVSFVHQNWTFLLLIFWKKIYDFVYINDCINVINVMKCGNIVVKICYIPIWWKKLWVRKKHGAYNVLISQMTNLSMCECFRHINKNYEFFFQVIGVFQKSTMCFV
jgi:hypothetical protein